MTLAEQVKILDDKIRANKAQYDLDRQASKISALSSGELEKYEYLTGENLGYKPDVVQKAKFEYSALGQFFNKGLNTSERKEGLLKRLKNIEGKNEQQLEAIRDQGGRQLEAIKDFSAPSKQKEIKFADEESQESKILRYEIKKRDRGYRNKKLVLVHSNRTLYDFSRFKGFCNFVHDIYDGNISTEDAKKEQDDLESETINLTDYNVRNQKKEEQKQEIERNAGKLFEIKNLIIDAFQNGVFPLSKKVQETQTKEKEKQTEEKKFLTG